MPLFDDRMSRRCRLHAGVGRQFALRSPEDPSSARDEGEALGLPQKSASLDDAIRFSDPYAPPEGTTVVRKSGSPPGYSYRNSDRPAGRPVDFYGSGSGRPHHRWSEVGLLNRIPFAVPDCIEWCGCASRQLSFLILIQQSGRRRLSLKASRAEPFGRGGLSRSDRRRLPIRL